MADPATLSWVKYGWETVYGTVTGTIDKPFGHGVRITTLQRRNNVEKVFSLGARNAQKLVEKQYGGTTTIEFALANPWFLRAVFGTVTSTTGTPDVHTFTEFDTLPSLTIENDINTDTASVAKILGGTVDTMVLTAAVNEIARVRLDIPYSTETFGSTTSAVVSESFELFTFAGGSLELPDATTIAEVQNIELTVNNYSEAVYGLGSRFAQKMPVKNREYSSRVTLAFEESATMLEKLYGSSSAPNSTVAESATMELVFDNGESPTSDDHRQISFVFTGIKIDEESLSQDPTTLIMEDVNIGMRSCVCTARNATTTPP